MGERPAGTRGWTSRLSVLAISPAGLLTLSAAAIAGSTTSPSGQAQTLQVHHSPAKASKGKRGRGVNVKLAFSLRKVDGSSASAQSRWDLRFPKGMSFAQRKFPYCDLVKLQTKGPKACPKRFIVGRGSGREDARPFIEASPWRFTAYNAKPKNGKPTLMLRGVPKVGSIEINVLEFRKDPAGPYGVRLINRRGTICCVPLPTMSSLSLRLGAKITKTKRVRVTRGGRSRTARRRVTYNYLENPRRCRGSWKWRLDVEYENGEKLKPTDSVRCRK